MQDHAPNRMERQAKYFLGANLYGRNEVIKRKESNEGQFKNIKSFFQ